MPIFTRVTIAKKGSQTAKKQRLRLLRQANRLKQLGAYDSKHSTQVGKPTGKLEPPAPPLALTPAIAADPETAIEVLWRIARDEPELRRWLVINPKADASLLEYVSQAGGPGVKQALNVLFESLDALESERAGPAAGSASGPTVSGAAA